MKYETPLTAPAEAKGAAAPPIKISLANPGKGLLGNPAVGWNGERQGIQAAAH